MPHLPQSTTDMPTAHHTPALQMQNGTTLELGEQIGKGGFAEVHACTLGMQRAAAKVLLWGNEERGRKILQDEGLHLRTLTIGQVPRFLGSGTVDGERPAMLMERVDGVCMHALLRRFPGRRFPSDLLRHVAYGCAAILREVHEHGILHRDVKTGNFLLGRKRDNPNMLAPWLVDFGLAKRMSDPENTRLDDDAPIGQGAGTPSYMDPFILSGDVPRGPSSDVFSLGLCIYEALRGKLPCPETEWRRFFLKPDSLQSFFRTDLQARTRSERRWMDLLRPVLGCNPDKRISATDVGERLCAMGADKSGGIGLHIEDANDPQEIAAAIMRMQERRKSRCRWIITGTAATLLGVGALLCQGKGTPPADAESAPLRAPEDAPHQAKEKEPIRAPRYPQVDVLLQKTRTNALRASGLKEAHTVHVLDLTTEELCALLEEGKPGTSVGLPRKTQYSAYMYTQRPGMKDEELLLQLTRGCFHRHGGVTHFHKTSDLGGAPEAEEVRKFLATWKKIDGGSNDKNTIRRTNDHLDELKKAAGVR